MKPKKSKVALVALLAIGCMPFYLAGCGDDTIGGGGDDGGTSGSGGGAGRGGKSAGGTSSSGTGNGEGGEGGGEPTGGKAGSGGAGGKAGAGGVSGSGGKGGNGGVGGKAGTAGVGGNAGTAGGGAGGTTAGNVGSGGEGGGAAGEGGSAGEGGGPAGPSCGNGIVEDDEVCDRAGGDNYLEDDCGDKWGTGNGITGVENDCQEITPPGCVLCEEASECAELTDPLTILAATTATEGPATGRARFALYQEALDCVRDTKCAAVNTLDCYCGTVDAGPCDAGNGNGVCKIVLERALETTSPTEISNRFTNVTLGGGLAMSRINCDKLNCSEQCF